MPETVGETSAAVAPSSAERARLERLSSKDAYDAFLSKALTVQENPLQECKADAALVHDAVKRGVEAVLSHESELAQLPDVDVEELRSLPWLVQGLAFALLQQQRSWSTEGRTSADSSLPSLTEATELRDRFWTLLLQRHKALWRCGAWIYGQEVDSHVPPLQPRGGWQAAVAQSQGASRLAEMDSSPPQLGRRERFTIRIGPDLSKL